MRRLFLLAVAAALLAGCRANPPSVEPAHLANGLTVILRPVSDTSDVALVVLYSIGEGQDPEGESGLAHLVEHCYVTTAAGETPARGIQEYTAQYPQGWNAQTGDDYTVFGCVFPRANLKEELRDAAARMGDLRIDESDLQREKPRLFDELANMYGGIPALAARNLARERVSPSPRGGLKGGIEEQIASLHAARVRSWWQRYYKPANATLVLAGDFSAPEARQLVADCFGGIPAGEPAPPLPDRPEPSLPAMDTVHVESTAADAAPAACIAFAAPTPKSDLYAPLLVLAARLWSRAAELGTPPAWGPPVAFAPLDDPAAITISIPLRPGETPEQVIARLQTFVLGVAQPYLDAADIQAAEGAFGLPLGLVDLPDAALAQNLYGTAFSLGRRAQMGINPAALGSALRRMTADDVGRAANGVFSADDRAAVVVIPDATGKP